MWCRVAHLLQAALGISGGWVAIGLGTGGLELCKGVGRGEVRQQVLLGDGRLALAGGLRHRLSCVVVRGDDALQTLRQPVDCMRNQTSAEP